MSKKVEQLERTIRLLKSERDQQDPSAWSAESRALLKDIRTLIGYLELRASSLSGIDLDDTPSPSHPDDRPMPGEAQTPDRRRLQRLHRNLARAVSWMQQELEAEAEGKQRPRREPRPKCPECGRKGQPGDKVCGRGCGPLSVKEAA